MCDVFDVFDAGDVFDVGYVFDAGDVFCVSVEPDLMCLIYSI